MLEAGGPGSVLRRGFVEGWIRVWVWVWVWVEAVDEALEGVLEPRLVVFRVLPNQGDDFSVAVRRLSVVTPGLVDHAEAVIAIVRVGKALQQVMGGLFGFVELAGFDHVDDGIGGEGQIESQFLFIIAIEVGSATWASRFLGRLAGDEGSMSGLLVLGEAALLVLLATAAGAAIIPSDLGHFIFSQKDGSLVPSTAGGRQIPSPAPPL